MSEDAALEPASVNGSIALGDLFKGMESEPVGKQMRPLGE